MSAHTPGPWHVIDNSWEISSVYAADESLVAEIPIASECDEDTQVVFEKRKEANARLIAAAPSLLVNNRRYQWLRSKAKRSLMGSKKHAGDIQVVQWEDTTTANVLSLEALDAAIDAALAKAAA